MSRLVPFAAFLAFLVTLGLSEVALADVPPPDSCQTAGESCNNAGPDYKSPGVCTSQTCSKTLPGADAPYTYACLLCTAGGPSNDAGSGTGNGDDGGDDGGCRISPRTGSALVSLLVLGSILGLFVRRRRFNTTFRD
jgi:hypothetical protein